MPQTTFKYEGRYEKSQRIPKTDVRVLERFATCFPVNMRTYVRRRTHRSAIFTNGCGTLLLVNVTNLTCAYLVINIGVPFPATHDVKDQNHDNTLLVVPFGYSDYGAVQAHYCAVTFEIDGESRRLHE